MRLRRRFHYHPQRKRAIRKGLFLGNLLIPAAAIVIIMMGIIAYFHFFFPDPHEMTMAEHREAPQAILEEANEENTQAGETNQTTIGGVMINSEDEEVEETIHPPSAGSKEDKENEIVEVVVIDDEVMEEEAIISIETDDDISIARPEVLDEAVVVHAAEEMAAGDISGEPKLSAKSRAKGDSKKEKQETVFSVTEQMPEYPGGMDSLRLFLSENLIYPVEGEQIKDTAVIAQFMINKKGKIKNISILQSAGKAFDDEVIRVIRMMPEWAPAMQRGEPISVNYTLPVYFKAE